MSHMHTTRESRVLAGLPAKAVLVALGPDRQAVVARARLAGCDLDRWKAQDWQAMAGEMTRLEDGLELEGQGPVKAARREALRAMRRQLEDACDRADRGPKRKG